MKKIFLEFAGFDLDGKRIDGSTFLSLDDISQIVISDKEIKIGAFTINPKGDEREVYIEALKAIAAFVNSDKPKEVTFYAPVCRKSYPVEKILSPRLNGNRPPCRCEGKECPRLQGTGDGTWTVQEQWAEASPGCPQKCLPPLEIETDNSNDSPPIPPQERTPNVGIK